MKNKFLLISIILFSFNTYIFGQNNEILLTIEGDNIDKKEISKAEFERIYKKNNAKDKVVDVKSLKEYLELFINFQLKVSEAEELKLDTLSKFKKELEGYRKQLAKPYLVDKDVDEKLLKEAYERMKYDVRANHILIKLSENAQAKDTLKAYKKAMKIRKRILKGEKFDKVAKSTSDDPSAKINGGDLGYFTAFQMLYDFETTAYNTKNNEISMPVRTKYGYHIIKTLDKRKARGKIKVAHIMLTIKKDADEKTKKEIETQIYDIYKRLKKGEKFSDLAEKFSADKGTSKKGGELPFFGVGRMLSAFENASFSLQKNNDISEPIQTDFGWHIIKRLDIKELEDFEVLKPELKRKISRDTRALKSKKIIIEKLKKEYNYQLNKKNLEVFYTLVDTMIFHGKWTYDKEKDLNETLFSFADKKFTQADFKDYMFRTQTKGIRKMPIETFVNKLEDAFSSSKILKYEENLLEKKYPEFRFLMNEYHDGMLLFDLTDQKIWSKASADTIGLQKYHEANKGNYMWDKRVKANIYICKDDDICNKTLKLLKKRAKKNYSDEEILSKINKKNKDNLKIKESKIYAKEDNKLIDKLEWKANIIKKIEDKTSKEISIIEIIEVIKPTPKALNIIKGTVTADYQTFLEKEWIKTLKSKYKVTVNEKLLSKIK